MADGFTTLTSLERSRVRPGLWHIEGYEARKTGRCWEVRRISGSGLLFRSATLHEAAEEIAYRVQGDYDLAE